MSPIDLAREMAAARERREQRTEQALRESRALAVRVAVRPGSSRTEIEDVARSFYPRLDAERIREVTELVVSMRDVAEPVVQDG
jgi:hypothetical protein